MPAQTYIAVIHKERASDFGVSFPDFPGCITAGKTIEEAKDMALEALQFHIEGLIEDREPIPAPSHFDDLLKEDAIYVFVPVNIPTSATKRINITIESDLLDKIDSVVDNRSAFLAEAARKALAELPPRNPRAMRERPARPYASRPHKPK